MLHMSINSPDSIVEDEIAQPGTPDNQKELQSNIEERLKRIQTKQDQIDAYGAELWNGQFKRLSEIEELPGVFAEGEKLRNELWSKILYHSKFRRFQEAFCKPEDFIIPVPQVADGKFSYPRSFDFTSVKGCLADVDTVPTKLLQDLTLLSSEELEGLDDLESVEMKYSKISALKKAWEAAFKIAPVNSRMLIVHEPDEKVRSAYPDVPDPADEVMGSFLYSREQEREKYDPAKIKKMGKTPKKLIVAFYPDAYRAKSKTHKQQRNYERNEIPLLTTLANDLKTLNEHFDDDWTADATDETKDELMKEAYALIARFEEALKGATGSHKKRILELFATMKVQLEKFRSSPLMNSMVTSIETIVSRHRARESKSAHNTVDQDVLTTIIEQQQDNLLRVREAVERGSKRIGTKNLIVFSNAKEATPAVVDATIRGIMRDLRLPRHTAQVPVRPFRTYVNILNAQSDNVEGALKSKDLLASKHAAIEMHVIGKIQGFHTGKELLKQAISDPDNISMHKVRQLVARMNTISQGREVFPEETPMHLAEVYRPIEETLAHLQTLMTEAGQNIETDEDVLKKFCEEMNTLLDSLNFEQIARDFATKAALEVEN